MDGIRCANCGYSNVFYCGSLDVIWDSQIPMPIEDTFDANETDVVQRKFDYQLSKLHPATLKKFRPQIRERRVLSSEYNNILVHCEHCNTLNTTPLLFVRFNDGELRISADRCGKCHRPRREVVDENLHDTACPACGSKTLEPFIVIY